MKHRQIGNPKIGIVNADGHAIGLDIGATAVRAAILSHGTHEGRPAVTIHGLGHIGLPFGAVVNGVVVDQLAVTAAIKQLWSDNRFECHNVIVGISNQQVVVRDMTMPNLPPEQLAKALPFQAKEIVPIPMDQAIIDFSPLGAADAATDTIAGLLVASPRQPIIAAVTAVERAGLNVARVDLATFAALRAIAEESLSVEAVVDMGAHVTNIIIHNQGVPKVVRTVPRGGQELTERIADRSGLKTHEAEDLKRKHGLSGTDRSVSDAVAEGIRPLIAEIRSSLNYFNQTNAGAQLQRISLTGGGSGLRGIAEALTDQLGIPTAVVEPMRHIRNRWASKSAQQEGSELAATAVSVGLAMGAAA